MANRPIKNVPGMTGPPGYKLNPFSGNWIYCPDPKVINPATGRCVNPDSKTLGRGASTSSSTQPLVTSAAAAKPLASSSPPKASSKQPQRTNPGDFKLNPFSGNWIYCPDPKVINPETGKCVNPDSRTISKSSKKNQQMPQTGTIKMSPKGKRSSPKGKMMERMLKDYMTEIAEINKLAGKKHGSLKLKSKKSKSKRRMTL